MQDIGTAISYGDIILKIIIASVGSIVSGGIFLYLIRNLFVRFLNDKFNLIEKIPNMESDIRVLNEDRTLVHTVPELDKRVSLLEQACENIKEKIDDVKS